MKPSHRIKSNIFQFILLIAASWIIYSIYTNLKSQNNNKFSDVGTVSPERGVDTLKSEIIVNGFVFQGVDNESRPYQISSKLTLKTSENDYQLFDIAFKYPTSSQEIFFGNAGHAILNDLNKILELNDNVKLQMNNYAFRANYMRMDLSKKQIKASGGVNLSNENLKVNSQNFQLKNKNIMEFNGNVSSSINVDNF